MTTSLVSRFMGSRAGYVYSLLRNKNHAVAVHPLASPEAIAKISHSLEGPGTQRYILAAERHLTKLIETGFDPAVLPEFEKGFLLRSLRRSATIGFSGGLFNGLPDFISGLAKQDIEFLSQWGCGFLQGMIMTLEPSKVTRNTFINLIAQGRKAALDAYVKLQQGGFTDDEFAIIADCGNTQVLVMVDHRTDIPDSVKERIMEVFHARYDDGVIRTLAEKLDLAVRPTLMVAEAPHEIIHRFEYGDDDIMRALALLKPHANNIKKAIVEQLFHVNRELAGKLWPFVAEWRHF